MKKIKTIYANSGKLSFIEKETIENCCPMKINYQDDYKDIDILYADMINNGSYEGKIEIENPASVSKTLKKIFGDTEDKTLAGKMNTASAYRNHLIQRRNEMIDFLKKINSGTDSSNQRIEIKGNSSEKKEKKIHSYHTFLFPFRIEKHGSNAIKDIFNNRKTRDFIEEILEKSNLWEKDDRPIQIKLNENDNNLEEHYNRIQYFNDTAIKAINGNDDAKLDPDAVVHNWNFNGIKHHNTNPDENAEFIIQAGKMKEYQLYLNAIRLKIYNTQIAIMIFEVENHQYEELDEIKEINEFGRRICSPNLTVSSRPCSFYWGINFKKKNSDRSETPEVEYDSYKMFERLDKWKNSLKEKSDDNEREKLQHELNNKVFTPICDIITYGMDGQKKITSNVEEWRSDKSQSSLLLVPVIDDRMFVCSLAKNNIINEIKEIVQVGEECKYAYETNSDLAKELYAFMYIDQEDATMQSIHGVQNLLERDIYDRWIDWGTLYGITHHSMMCLTSVDCPDHLINTFVTLYVDMATLVLAQRCSIIMFQEYASLLTSGLEKEEKSLKQKEVNQLLNFQEKYIVFQTQMLMFEVTPQEQGVEMYKMLQDAMYVVEEKEDLNEKLESLYNITGVNQDSKFNYWASIFAVVSIIIAVANIFIAQSDYNLYEKTEYFWIGNGIMIVLSAITWIVFAKIYRRNPLKK